MWYDMVVMKLIFTGQYQMNPRQLLRRCGYAEFVDPNTRQTSYVRHLGGLYPRFHAYLNLTDRGFTVNLHLDQKKPSYRGHTAHSGEYDGEVVDREGERIKAAVVALRSN